MTEITTYIEIDKSAFEAGTRQARYDWATVTGQPARLRPPIYRDTRDGQGYCNILGALAYPAMEPGCMIILGITTDKNFRILEFREHRTVARLLEDAVLTRRLYGWGLDKHVLRSWTGDELRYQTIVSKISQEIEKQMGQDTGLYIRDPLDFRERHAFPLYMNQIRQTLKDGRLDIPQVDLITRLQAMQHDAAEKGRIEDYPAAGILGGIVNSILTEEPWFETAEDGDAYNYND